MNSSMRKIIYYENILEFKENTESKLELKDVNNWNLCRTCLTETKDDDMDLEKMSVMDMMEGRFLSCQEMLMKIDSTIQVHKDDELPLKMCKDCIGKLTNLYFYSMQIEKSQDILRKLWQKLRGPVSEEVVECIKQICDESEIIDEACTSTSTKYEQTTTHVCFDECGSLPVTASANKESNQCNMDKNESQYENLNSIIDTNVDTENEDAIESLSEKVESTCYMEEIEEDVYVIEESIILDNATECNSNLEEIQTKNDVIPRCEKVTNNNVSIAEVRPEIISKRSFKHKQSRVSKPLLEEKKCGICEKIFDRQRDLVAHVKQEHPNSKAYQCRECLNFFSHTQSLSRHMNTHKPTVHKNTCEYCTKAFMRPEDLRRHIRTHTGERPFACPLCEKAFKQHSEVKEHIATHIEDKKYECNLCDRSFASRNNLYLHKKKHSQQ